jgi:DMSO/TMAO reductase YedYZ heme-binding membrane subunit
MKWHKINRKLCWWSLLSSVAVFIYVIFVVLLMTNSEKIFGKMTGVSGPIALLMLFVCSALITSSLVLGQPIYLYLKREREEAIRAFFYSVGWVFVITIAIFIFHAIF